MGVDCVLSVGKCAFCAVMFLSLWLVDGLGSGLALVLRCVFRVVVFLALSLG